MRVRSGVFMWLSHPEFKAARVALAAGAVAGLAVLGACADQPVVSDVAGPRAPSSPSYVPGVVGDFTHIVNVCVDGTSSAAPTVAGYNFTTVKSPVIVAGFPNSSSPNLEPGDRIFSSVDLVGPDCTPVFIRASPWSSGAVYETGDRVISGGVTWQALVNNSNVTPTEGGTWTQIAAVGNTDIGGGVNPRAKMLITATVPAGYTVDISSCINEGPSFWQDCTSSNTQSITSANIYHGGQVIFKFTQVALPTLFIVLDEDAIDNEDKPRFFTQADVNDGIAAIGQRTELQWFANNTGVQTVIWSGRMGDEGWFAPTSIPSSWATADGDGDATDGLRNFVGLPVAPGLGGGTNNKEVHLDKIPNVYPLRAEGLWLLMGRTVCAVVYDSHVGINYEFKGTTNTLGTLKGANLGIVAFTVDNVEFLGGESSSQLPKVTITVRDADTVCGGPLTLLTGAPVPQSSSEVVDLIPNGPG